MSTEIISKFEDTSTHHKLKHSDWFNLAYLCEQAYHKAEREQPVNKLLIADNLKAFHCLAFYSNLKDEDYYMSNLLKTGKLEGARREVIGLLPEAIDRTLTWLAVTETLLVGQVVYIPRCLKVLLEDETSLKTMKPLIGEILTPYVESLLEIAKGNI